MQFNLYAVVLLVSSALAFVLARRACVRRPAPLAAITRWMMLGVMIWSLAGAAEAIAITRSAKMLWSAVSYLGIQSVPLCFLLLALETTGRRSWLAPRRVALLAAIPLLTLLVAATHAHHGWLWSHVYMTETWIGVTAIYERGFWFWISAGYGYFMVLTALLLLLDHALNSPPIFSRQAYGLILAALLPLFGNLTYVIRPDWSGGMDYAPVFFTATGVVILMAMQRHQWLDVHPIPCHLLVSHLRVGLLVLDRARRLILINPAAQRYLSIPEDALGRPLDVLGSLHSEVLRLLEQPEDTALQIPAAHDPSLIIEWRHTRIHETGRRSPGNHLLTGRDITEHKRLENEQKTQVDLQRLLIDLAARFVIIPSARLEATIQEALALMGAFTRADRATLFEYDPSGASARITCAWNAPGIETIPAPRTEIASSQAPEWFSAHARGEPWIVPDTGALPTASPLRSLLEAQATRSHITLPLMEDDTCLGFVGFDAVQSRKDWTKTEQALLRVFAALLANARIRARSEERIRHLSRAVEQSPASIVITDTSGTIEYVNPKFEAITGYARAEAVGQNPRILKSGEQSDTGYRELWQIISAGQEWRGEFHNRRKDGSLYWEAASISPIRDAAGRITHYIAIKEDITARKQAEEEIRVISQRLAAVIRHFPGAVLMEDPQRRIALFNPSFQDLFRFPRTDGLLGADGAAVMSHYSRSFRDPERFLTRTREIMAAGKLVAGEEWNLGDGRILERDYSPLPGREIPEGHLWIYRDVTRQRTEEQERRTVERRVQRAQQLESLGAMAGGIAHDFNNLLMAILGNLELLQGDVPAGSEAAVSVAEAVQAAQRAAELTRQMLAYAGKGQFRFRRHDLNDIASGVLSLLRAGLPKTIRLETTLHAGLPPVSADEGQLRQAVNNLVTNAAEAIGEREGIIRMQTRLVVAWADEDTAGLEEFLEPGPYVELEVTDNGCGMDAETLRRIYEPFFSTKFMGRGLGMAAVQGIVRAHKGFLLIESRPGQGTRMRLRLPAGDKTSPRAPPPPAPDTSRSQEPPGRRPGRLVLLVDDEALVRRISGRMLARLGCRTLEAGDGKEAVEIFRRNADRIDVVLLDMTMPRMDGVATLQALKNIRPGVPVVIATGYDEKETAGKFSDGEIIGIAHKPFRKEDLRALLDRIPGRTP